MVVCRIGQQLENRVESSEDHDALLETFKSVSAFPFPSLSYFFTSFVFTHTRAIVHEVGSRAYVKSIGKSEENYEML